MSVDGDGAIIFWIVVALVGIAAAIFIVRSL